MGRGARTGLGVFLTALVGVAVLGAAGIVRIPFLRSASDAGPAVDRPDELASPDATSPGELAAAGGRPKVTRPGEAVKPDESAGPELASEVKGTAIGKAGGTIRGRVVETQAKRPVAGAIVELLMPEALFHYLRANPVGRFDRLTAQTDAAGRFEFAAVLPASDYALRARKGAGPYVTKRDLSLSAREVLDAGDLMLGPSGGLSGHVVGADGKGLAGARVAVTWKIENEFNAVMADPETLPWVEATATTDADGAWKVEGLEPGDKTLVAKAPSGAADVKASVAVVAGTTTSGIDWTLGGSLAIAGRVEWADGKPIEGARVFAKTMQKPASFTVESGADGSFRLPGLADGVFFVGAFIPGMSVQLLPGRKAGDENVRIVVPLAGALSGRVVSKATGRPIPQFKITPVFADNQDWMQKFVAQKVGSVLGGAGFQSPDGAFRFDRLTSGHYTLRVEAEGYPPTDSASVEVIAGAEAKAGDVALADGHRISGVVRDAAGKPIPDATIVILNFDEFNFGGESLTLDDMGPWLERMPEETRSDEKGSFTTSPLTPRAYDVGVRVKGYLSRVAHFDVTSKPATGVEFRLESAGSVLLLARNSRGIPVVGAEFDLCDAAGTLLYARSEAEGRVERSDLRPGRWALIERRMDVESAYGDARKATPFDGSTFFERVRATPGVVDFSVAAGDRVERVVVVAARVRVEGRVRLGERRTDWREFYLESVDDPGRREWIGYGEDGAFAEPSVRVGRYVVFALVKSGDGYAPNEVGSLEVPDSGLEGIEIDLSK